MNIFITGATGFIGAYLARWLQSEGHSLLCLKRPTSNLELLGDTSYKVKWTDTGSDWKTDVKSFRPEIIFNLAWDGVSANDRVIWSKQVANVLFQQDMLDIGAECGCRRFVGIGSQSEYGDFDHLIDETFPVHPKTAYAAAKVASLEIMKSFCELHEIEWFWFRLFPVFGPGESDNWLIPSLIKKILTSDSMDLTRGEQRLPYLYVEECAKSIGHAVYASEESGIYNVCADNPMPLRNLVESIRNYVNPSFILNFGALPYRFGQSMYMEGDTTKLRTKIYNLNTNDFEDRLHDTIEYYIRKIKNE